MNRDDLTPAPAPEAPVPHTGTLRTDIEVIRGETGLDGQPSWVLFEPTSGNYFRISNRHYQVIRMLTHDQPLPDFLRKLEAAGVRMPEAEVTKVLGFLAQSNLLRPGYQATAQRVGKMREFKAGMFWHIVLSSYLFFRIPIWSPDRFLNATRDFIGRIFNRWTMTTLWILVIVGFISVIVNAGRFADAFVQSISLRGLVGYGIAVFFIKILHEFAHAYTAKRYGCRVRKMGVAVIFFFPRFYTDLTDAWRVASRRARMAIDSAGILCEIVIGGVAALVWVYSRGGLPREIAYYIFAVSIINTLFINGNPFIRYDGYYILMDAIGIDNLARRGVELFRAMWQKSLFGLAPMTKEALRGWRRGFLIFYAVGSFLYRIFLYTTIILLVTVQFGKEIGIVLLALEVWLLILKPLIGEVKGMWKMRGRIRMSRSLPALLGVGLILALFAVPLPWSVVAPAEVRAESNVVIYAGEAGFLEELAVADGAPVTAGTLIYRQRNPLLQWRIRESELDLEINEIELIQAQLSLETVSRLGVLKQARSNLDAVLGELGHRRDALTFRTPIDGVFALYDQHLTAGKWLERGMAIGEVFVPGRVRVTGYLRENDALEITAGEEVEIMIPDRMETVSGRVTAVHLAGARLSASPLLDVFGGPMRVYSDESGVYIPLESSYQIEVEVFGAHSLELQPGRTVTVTYRKSSSLAAEMLRSLLSALRREFNL